MTKEKTQTRLIDDTRSGPVATLVARGFLGRDQARRPQTALLTLERAGTDFWSITRLKKNPGAFMAEVTSQAPQVMADSKRKGAERIVAISETDLKALVDAVAKAVGPGFATGREMHERLARSGPPLDITTRGLPPRHQSRLSIDKALAASPTAFVSSAEEAWPL